MAHLPPVVVGLGKQQEDLTLLHPYPLAVLRAVLEVIADHHETVSASASHPHHGLLLL